MRPLKEKLAQLDRKYDELTRAVANYMDVARKGGAKRFSENIVHEAEKVAEEKRHIELERDKVKIDIEYQEKVVTDAKIIADSLLKFEKVFKALPPADQKEVIKLLIKEIRVFEFDPEKDSPEPAKKVSTIQSVGQETSPVPVNAKGGIAFFKTPEPGVFNARIRTKWYRVNMTLFATDLFSRACEKEGDKFGFQHDWLRRQDSNL